MEKYADDGFVKLPHEGYADDGITGIPHEKYGDEGFIRMLREGQEDAKNKDIKKGSVPVGGKELVFKEREIMKNLLWMWIPENFHLLGREMARLKYPNENRPDIIYTNPETTVNLNLSHKKEKLKAGQEEAVRDYMQQAVSNLYPSGSSFEKNTVEAGGSRLAWFDFVTPAIDSPIYNLLFFTGLEGRLLMGSCNCLEEDSPDWKGLFLQMIGTVRISS